MKTIEAVGVAEKDKVRVIEAENVSIEVDVGEKDSNCDGDTAAVDDWDTC